MKKLSLLVVSLFLAACGSANNADQLERAMGISSVTIEAPSAIVRVGEPVQLSLSITLTSGEKVEGVHDLFANPETGDSYIVNWSTSNVRFALIDNYGELSPRFEGFITVTASFGGVERTREMRVDNTYEQTPGAPLPDETTAVNEDISLDPPPNPDPFACQGHAVAVVWFKAGGNSGFGSTDMPNIVLGPPEGAGDGAGGYDVLSLGQYGEIILDLGDCEVVDGPGVDLIVFENAFFIVGDPSNPFHEFAAVGVSDDGVNFTEFTCDETAYPFDGCGGVLPVYSNTSNGVSPFDIANAGGDHFDLATIGVNRARYVRITDLGDRVPGGTIAGFDLDAISVVNGELQP